MKNDFNCIDSRTVWWTGIGAVRNNFGTMFVYCVIIIQKQLWLPRKLSILGVQLCNDYNVTDPVEFVERWMAFSISNLNGADPTLDNLNDMERKEFANFKQANESKIKSTSNQQSNHSSNYDNFPDDDIMDSYGFHTPKVNIFLFCYYIIRIVCSLDSDNERCDTERSSVHHRFVHLSKCLV